MKIINTISKFILWLKTQDYSKQNILKYQEKFLMYLINNNKETIYGGKYNFSRIKNIKDFQKQVPIVQYNDIEPYITRCLQWEQNILTREKIELFARTSGTTPWQIKYIPTTMSALKDNHFAWWEEVLKQYIKTYPESNIFHGKNLSLGWWFFPNPHAQKENIWYISSILQKHAPIRAKAKSAIPDTYIQINNREEKIYKIIQYSKSKHISTIWWLPNWILDFFEQACKYCNTKSIDAIRPSLECIFVWGTNYRPYKKQLEAICNKPIVIWEVYNASEWFIATQADIEQDDMLLLAQHGIFFEYIDMETLHTDNQKIYTLAEVQINKNYALVITTLAWLYRYIIGDTVKFTSIDPYKIKITGRTKTYIAAFGENVLVEHSDAAILEACSKTKSSITEYTVAPIFFNDQKGMWTHERYIEFKQKPKDMRAFTIELDNAMKIANNYYDRRRQNNTIIDMPIVKPLPKWTFHKRLKSKNKVGHQNKIPRLSNSRDFVEELQKTL